MKIVWGEASPRFKGWDESNIMTYEVSTVERDVIVGVDSPVDVLSVESDINCAETYRNGTIAVTTVTSPDTLDISIVNPRPDLCTVQENVITDKIDGTPESVRFVIKGKHFSALAYNYDFKALSQKWYDTTSFVTGTLGDHCMSQVKGLLEGKSPGADQNYITQSNDDIVNPSVTINPNFYLSEIDFSGITVITDKEVDDRYGPALVSPRHAIVATHVGWGVGNVLVFRKTDGSGYVITTILAEYRIPDRDVDLIYLDTEVTGCKIYKTMPKDWEQKYVPSIYNERSSNYSSILPVFRRAMHTTDDVWASTVLVNHIFGEEPSRLGITYPQGSSLTYGDHVENGYPSGAIGDPWEAGVAIGGDSGGASFLIINGEPILLMTTFTTHHSANFAYYTDDLNIQMNEIADVNDPLKGSYVLQHPDLSGFIEYA